jgi:hypothetical protein
MEKVARIGRPQLWQAKIAGAKNDTLLFAAVASSGEVSVNKQQLFRNAPRQFLDFKPLCCLDQLLRMKNYPTDG